MLNLPGHYWKWRMHGGAVSLARMFKEQELKPDLILASDMLDLTTFLALTRNETSDIKTAIYFHENQLTYPWSPTDRDVENSRDGHYAFVNYSSALAADRVFFNSRYHRNSFLGELPGFLKGFPDYNELDTVQEIEKKSEVLHLGVDLKKFDAHKQVQKGEKPLIIWNHRWEYDKNPEEFFDALFQLQDEGHDFAVAILGQSYPKKPAIFNEAKEKLGDKVVQFGYAKSFDEYAQWLWKGDILPVTSNQDFFGGSVVEAMYCNCYPLLPNRLAYPEHIPEQQRGAMIYERGLKGKLKEAMRDIEVIRSVETSAYVAAYDWSAMAGVYDRAFDDMM